MIKQASVAFDLLRPVETMRLNAACLLTPERRAALGQYLTPAPLARLLTSLLVCDNPTVSLLDAGAGVGSLFAAVVDALCQRDTRPERVHIVAYEVEPALADCADQTLCLCRRACEQVGIAFSGEVRRTDFLCDAVRLLAAAPSRNVLPRNADAERFTCAIQNPPYRKIHTDSEARRYLRQLGIETTNLYTGFLFAAMRLLAENGELAAITPRSFCNGRYFRPFREAFLSEMALQRFHLFDTRQEVFKGDAVLQETLILKAVKAVERPEKVLVSSGISAEDGFLWREVPYAEVVRPDDLEQFIRIAPDEAAKRVAAGMARFQTPLETLGLQVSTGRVVDFRAREHLRLKPEPDAAPLIWPLHLNAENDTAGSGYIVWPRPSVKKPNALAVCPQTNGLRVPNGNYVLVKRFSAKEQKKRIMAAIYEGNRIPAAEPNGVGFENHLNYFHADGAGFDLTLARGLSVFLNATLTDEFFRLYSGHTQVNATDLRSLRYPTRKELMALGASIGTVFPDQEGVDRLIERFLPTMESEGQSGENPVAVKKRVDEALSALLQLGIPASQRNERSALTLLALLNLKPGQAWAEASNPLLGITPIMNFMATQYGKSYAPNTRETIRRFTVHQFLDAGLLVANPDQPDRAVNSPQNVYQVEASALSLLRTFGTVEWERAVETYLATVTTLKDRYAQARAMFNGERFLGPY